MKRLPLAALLAVGALALARADEGAYRNLVGMAQAAATDRGPNPDDVPANPPRGTDALKDAIADVPAPSAAPAPRSGGAEGAAAAPERPRLWARLSAALRPARRPAALSDALEPQVSTAAVRAPSPLPALMPPPDSAAVEVGERRGLEELLSTTAAQAGGR